MKPSEKRWILGLIIITIIMIIILNVRNSKKEPIVQGNDNVAQNASSQEIDEVTFSDIKNEYDTGITTLSANMTNNSNETKNFTVSITLRDDNGKVVQRLTHVVENLEPGKSKILRTGIFGDYSKIKDIQFVIINEE